ncbi:hypothetical protein [Wolbachia endosymbiont of Oedothorax gibbosus]|uniref:hypothetical protein n=1 Tax=Wolbachia endosymbiont of Oedothorax gibbosus TaxID=931100 RepID=UPI002024A517|nr:hypothetical protein [Wolbachia endosymbiont of Oedothorax gibbosus]
MKFNWYVGERECSITLSANSNGSIKIVGDKPADEDLEKNKDVRIKVGDRDLSLVNPSYGLTNEVKLRNTGLFRLH